MAQWGIGGERADAGEQDALDRERHRRGDDEATAERREVEWAATSWHGLVVGSIGREVQVTTSTGSEVCGYVVDHGNGWCQIDPRPGTGSVIVILAHVIALRATPRITSPQLVQRSVGSPLRRWARTRDEVCVELVEGSLVRGRVVQVLSDAVTVIPVQDALATEPGPARRPVTIPSAAVVCVRGQRLTLEP